MKRRLSAVLLALGLGVSVFSMGVVAEETETAATEQVTEAVTEQAADAAATEQVTEAATEKSTEAVTEQAADAAATEAPLGEESEAAEAQSEVQTEALSEEEQLTQMMTQLLTVINSYTDEQLAQMMESDDASTAAIAANWNSVKDEVGNFVEITQVEEFTSEDKTTFTVVSHAKYDKLDDNTDVTVTYEVNQKAQTVSFNWEVNYTLGKLMQRAALNTVMGICIVFLTLLFLSFLISKLHIIPDMIEGRAKKDAPAAPAAPAAPVAAPVAVEEEELVDDLELVAVITAAIAASENTSSDGFVVRSIKKSNKRNWQRA